MDRVRSGGRLRCQTSVDPNSGLAAIRSGSNGSPLIPHITRPPSPTRVNRNSRVRVARDSWSPSNSAISESCRGTLLSSFSLRVTRKRITFAVLPSPMRFFSATSVPTSYFEKSMTTTKRSACAIRIVRWRIGAPSSPPSLPTWTKGVVSRLQGKVVAAGVGGIEDAEAVFRVRDLHYRPRSAIDQDGVSEDAVHVVILDARLTHQRGIQGRIEERAVLIKRAVADHERDVFLALGEGQGVLFVVADDVKPGESPPDLGSCEVHAVVVVPERGAALLVRIDVVLEEIGVLARWIMMPRAVARVRGGAMPASFG